MRLDRLITLGLVHPLRRAKAQLAPVPAAPVLPVLMYHSISADDEAGVGAYYKVCTSPSRFAEHMQWLADWGYRGVTLNEGLAALREPEPIRPAQGEHGAHSAGSGQARSSAPGTGIPQSPLQNPQSPLSPSPRLVAITFDDGFRDFHTTACPVLQRHGFAATMYLPTAFIGTERQTFKGRECLTWDEVRELHGAGMEFGSHTVNHPELVRVSAAQLGQELRDSKRSIERELGAPVWSFAYPYAFPSAHPAFVGRLRTALHQAGYISCVTTEIGPARTGDDPLQLKRLPANEADDAPLLHAKITGDYDWLRGAQRFVKRSKQLLSRSAVPA